MKENKLGVMPINKLIWNMSLPIIASMLVQALYNIVDSIFVSQISEQALTAVSLAFPAQQLMISLASGTAVGINALLGHALGAGNRKRANDVACNGLFLAVASSLACCVLVALFSNTFFSAQTKVQPIIDMGNAYLYIVGCCSMGVFVQITFERLLQGTGRSILSMLTQGTGAIINIILDPIFIFVFDMGVAGAAWATVVGQICGSLLAIWLNHTKNPDIHLNFRPDEPVHIPIMIIRCINHKLHPEWHIPVCQHLINFDGRRFVPNMSILSSFRVIGHADPFQDGKIIRVVNNPGEVLAIYFHINRRRVR